MTILAHEYAELFPMMGAVDYAALVEGMRKTGYDKTAPIVLYQEKVLDGRNRLKAALELGIDPPVIQYDGDDPLAFVIRHNLNRRHLNESQRAVVAGRLANMTRGGDGSNQHVSKSANLQNSEKVTQAAAAAMLNVSPRTVATVKAVEKAAPELVAKIESGEMTAHEASKEVKKRVRSAEIQEQRAAIAEGNYKSPDGLFEVISLDPPWPYGTNYDPDGRRAANPYPEMSLEQIASLDIPASADSILFLWTTHKFMRYSFALLDGWGFRDVAIITWEKDRIGLGSWLRSRSEFCIMAVKGSPRVTLTNQSTVIHGALREHSRKPDEFYELVDGLCIGRKLDYFSREARPGWEQFGNDPNKF